jgi:glycosyltransferase involved in cell wall biosynthesis
MKWLFLDLPVRKAKWITTVSLKSKEEIIRYTNCDQKKIIVIANPLSENCINVCSNIIAEEARLLFVGTKQNKNLENVIPALHGLKIHLRIIGDLTHNQHLLLRKFEIKYSNASDLTSDELSREYQNADLILFPSLYEGFGLPVIEGFCAGKPVITSNISPMKEIAGDAAFLVDPQSISSIRNAVSDVINNPELRRLKVEKGKLIARSYQSKNIYSQYENLWKQVYVSSQRTS